MRLRFVLHNYHGMPRLSQWKIEIWRKTKRQGKKEWTYALRVYAPRTLNLFWDYLAKLNKR